MAKDERKKRNKELQEYREAITNFGKYTEEKFVKKNKKYYGKKEAKQMYLSDLEYELPGTIMFLLMQGYVNKPDIQELKYNACANLTSNSFLKYLTEEIKDGADIENIEYLPIIIKEFLEQLNRDMQKKKAENPDAVITYDGSDLVLLSRVILKKKMKKMKKKGIDERLAFDVLSIIPDKKVMELYASSRIYRLKSLLFCMYTHAKTKEVPFQKIIDIILGEKYYPGIISFLLLERKEKFGNLDENQKKFYIQLTQWCFDTLEKELSKREIRDTLTAYVNQRRRDELNGRDGNRRYVLSTLSETDYPKIKKIINEMIVQDESVRKYL